MGRIRFIEKVKFGTRSKLKLQAERYVELSRRYVKADLPIEVRGALSECFMDFPDPDVNKWIAAMQHNSFWDETDIILDPIDDLSEMLANVILLRVDFMVNELEIMDFLIGKDLIDNGTHKQILARIYSKEVYDIVDVKMEFAKGFIKENSEVIVTEGFIGIVQQLLNVQYSRVTFMDLSSRIWSINDLIKRVTELKYGVK